MADTGTTPEELEANEYFMGKLRANYPDVNNVGILNEYSVGDIIENFDEYIIIS